MFHLLTNAPQNFVAIIQETNSPDVIRTFRVSDATTAATNEGFNLHPTPAPQSHVDLMLKSNRHLPWD